MKAIHEMTVAELGVTIHSNFSITEACLARIEKLSGTIHAWITVDREGASQTSEKLALEVSEGRIRSALHGIPIGLKDVYDVAGMITTSGTRSFAHQKPEMDAQAVTALRTAGAVILGKTVTTEFALTDPARTRNPWSLDHTPGGSSSGSAAAVAAHLVLAALGTQLVLAALGTQSLGSVYCGIVGLKPTHGRISFRGITPVAPSLDHVGMLVKTAEDAAIILGVLAGYDSDDPYSVDTPVPH